MKEPVPTDAPASQIWFGTLGRFRIYRNGSEVAGLNWPTSKTRDLLAFMVHSGEAASRDKLLGNLWAGAERERATGLLHTTVYYLRRVLDGCSFPELIVYGNRQYRLAAARYGNDRDEFLDFLAAGLRPGAAPADAAACLEKAAGFYRGTYLEELNYPWLLPLREALKQKYLDARERLAGYYLDTGGVNQAIAHLLAAEEINPFSDQVQLLLMRAYAGLGDRQAVHRQFRKMESCLREAGLAPSPAVTESYSDLLKL